MNRRYYVFVALASALALAAGTAGLLGNPGVSFWLGIMAALAVGYSLIVAMERARDLSEKYKNLDETAARHFGELSRLRTEATEAAAAIANLQRVIRDNGEANADMTEKLQSAERVAQQMREVMKETQEKLQALRPVLSAANELALAAVNSCERLLEAAMAAEKAGDKKRRDEALLAAVAIKSVFADDEWLAEHWYEKLPSFEQLPTEVLKGFVGGELFQKRGGVHNNTPLHAELERALARKFV